MVSFDTMLLIWGVKHVATPGQEGMIGRAERLITHLLACSERIVLTTPVVAEYVGAFHPDDQPEQFRILRENFVVFPFDLRASAIAAELLFNKELVKALQGEYSCSRQVIKTDMMIIAASVASGCRVLYSHEYKKFSKAAQGKILVEDVPEKIERLEGSSDSGASSEKPLKGLIFNDDDE